MTCNCNRSGDCQTPPEPCPDCARLVRAIKETGIMFGVVGIVGLIVGFIAAAFAQGSIFTAFVNALVGGSSITICIAVSLMIVAFTWQQEEE